MGLSTKFTCSTLFFLACVGYGQAKASPSLASGETKPVADLVLFEHCDLKPPTKKALLELKAKQWLMTSHEQQQKIAFALSTCLGNPDPQLRDEIAFEGLSFMMRKGLLNVTTLQNLRINLLQKLTHSTNENKVSTEKPQEFIAAFSALVLAEIARIDRIQAFLSPEQRAEMLDAAVRFISQIKDYRGFDEQQGWRHEIAHTADWLMQLSLNPALSKSQHQQILDAISSQVAPRQHFYHFGESERLMRPVYWIALRGNFTQSEWSAWLNQLEKASVSPTATMQEKLAQQHNLSFFLLNFYYAVQESKDASIKESVLIPLKNSLKNKR
jgi:hypothetical protein